jgi:hypothetical protein
MCSGSYERSNPASRNELYRPCEALQKAIGSVLVELMPNPDHTAELGRKVLGVQHYATGGWFSDDRANRIIELKARWVQRGPVANYFLNPHRPRTTVELVSVAHIQPPDIHNTDQTNPYRLFVLDVHNNHLDTCLYDDYETDAAAVQELGSWELMREQLELARAQGNDVVTPRLETELIRSIERGQQLGWQPLQSVIA